MKAEKMRCQQTCERSPAAEREMTPNGNLDRQKGMKSTENGKCVGKYKINFSAEFL